MSESVIATAAAAGDVVVVTIPLEAYADVPVARCGARSASPSPAYGQPYLVPGEDFPDARQQATAKALKQEVDAATR